MEKLEALYVNREISWLEFNERVLKEAAERSVPLAERLKFLSIYFSNLDEFFMVRAGSLSDQMIINPGKKDEMTGWSLKEQSRQIFAKVKKQNAMAAQYYEEICREFAVNGIDIVDFQELPVLLEALLWSRFEREIRPLLSPQIIDRHHPFPFLTNKVEYIAVRFESKSGHLKIGMIPTDNLPPFFLFQLEGRIKVVFTAELLSYFSEKIYENHTINEKYIIRITRNADITVDEAYLDYDIDFRGVMQELLKKRKRLSVVRIQIDHEPEESFAHYLCEQLSCQRDVILSEKQPLDFSFGFLLPGKLKEHTDRFPLEKFSYPRRPPFWTIDFNKTKAVKYISGHDMLLAYPFQSMKPFIQLLEEAAEDSSVVSVKISLYRLANHSKIASALIRAAENGKQVICILELRARFDEQSNIDYAKMMEEAGCTVLYGLSDYKIHAKLCLITRLSHGKISYITQIGTGNYNEKTSEQYTDLSFLTADEKVGKDAMEIFAALCMGEIPVNKESLWVAPNGFKSNVIKEIEEEAAYCRQHGSGYIAIKVNSLNDMDIMKALIEASQAGVRIYLYIRGICCLRPGVEGYTDNITVKSVVGRYLEHSRIFIFGRREREKVLIGSGDLLKRNTIRRVEIFTQIPMGPLRDQVRNVIEALEADNVKGWMMQPDGHYEKKERKNTAPVESQMYLSEFFAQKIRLPGKFSKWFKKK